MKPTATKRYRNVILKSKPKYVLAIVISILFLLASILVSFFWGIVFWGFIVLLALVPLLYPGIRVFFLNTRKYQEHFTELHNSSGIFSYITEKTFQVNTKQACYEIDWLAIQAIFVYRVVDGYAGPQVCMDIFCDNSIHFTFSEETAGWNRFLVEIEINLAVTEKNWYSTIDELKIGELVLLYERERRSLSRAKMIYY